MIAYVEEMGSGFLPICDDSKQRCRALAERSARPENWYYPFAEPPSAGIPGDSEDFTIFVGSFRVVFTYTVDREGLVCRHASVSDRDKLPAPPAAFTIVTWLGFTGAEADEDGLVMRPAPDWVFEIHPAFEKCVAIGQRIPRSELP